MHRTTPDHVGTGALARPAERSSAKLAASKNFVELRSTRTGEGARPHVAGGGPLHLGWQMSERVRR
jgi:hypothetical protein